MTIIKKIVDKYDSHFLLTCKVLLVCKIVDVTIPEIEVMRLAHYSTIGSECTTSLGSHLEKLYIVFHHFIFFTIIFYRVRNQNNDIRNTLQESCRNRMGCKGGT
jgi:hypothetical protein